MEKPKELFNDEAEKTALSILMTYPKETKIYLTKIRQDYFFDPTCSKIFRAIKDLAENNEAVDIITVGKKSNIKAYEIADIINKHQSFYSSIPSYIKILKEYANKRWFYSRICRVNEKEIEKEIASLSVDISNRLKDNSFEQAGVKDIIEEFSVYQEENKKHFESGKQYIGHPTGFKTIDDLISGIRKGHYWIISAYTSTGKSSFLLNIANQLLNDGKRILFFSLEMSRIQNIARILGVKTGISPLEIEKGTLTEYKLEAEIEAKSKLYEQKLTIYTNKRDIDDIIITILAEHSTEPVDVVFIDYLQKIQNNSSSRYERYTISSDKIQSLVQETGIPVIAASQIDNESAKNRNDDIISTKGSGDVAGDVDFAVLLRRNPDDQTLVDGIVQKNRHGQRGRFAVRFFEGGQLLEQPI